MRMAQPVKISEKMALKSYRLKYYLFIYASTKDSLNLEDFKGILIKAIKKL